MEERAWAAGFFDGEGSFGIQRQAGHRSIPYAQITQVDRFVLDRFFDVVETGKVYGPYHSTGNKGSDYFYYRATGDERVKAIWEIINPWLSPIKREQHERAIANSEPPRDPYPWLAEGKCKFGHAGGRNKYGRCIECKREQDRSRTAGP